MGRLVRLGWPLAGLSQLVGRAAPTTGHPGPARHSNINGLNAATATM
jgi:hypothetical protein